MKSKKEERNQEICALFLDGYTANDIGRMYGISKQRVSFILHGLGIRADEEFTTVILPDPYIVGIDFGDELSSAMVDWSGRQILPRFDEVILTTPATVHSSLRKFGKMDHVVAYVPVAEGAAIPGREIKSSWLVYAYPMQESRFRNS